MERRHIFPLWFFLALVAWALLFARFVDLHFLAAPWFYPAIMVLGGFVAGITPEGGGAVAFPVLSVFFEVDRAMARDFSLMIQSVGMTSASERVLTSDNQRAEIGFCGKCIFKSLASPITGQAKTVLDFGRPAYAVLRQKKLSAGLG